MSASQSSFCDNNPHFTARNSSAELFSHVRIFWQWWECGIYFMKFSLDHFLWHCYYCSWCIFLCFVTWWQEGDGVVFTFLSWRQSTILCRLLEIFFGVIWCSEVALVPVADIVAFLVAWQSALILVLVVLSKIIGATDCPILKDSPELALILAEWPYRIIKYISIDEDN